MKIKEHRKALKSCYNKIFGKKKINNTSLVVFTGPVKGYSAINLFYDCSQPHHYIPGNEISYCGSFLTGDLDLNFCWESFCKHFWHHFSDTFLFQIPHHGSKHNWKNSILDKINESFLLISAGLKNKHDHPHKEVLEKILKRLPEFKLFWINEFWSFKLEPRVWFND